MSVAFQLREKGYALEDATEQDLKWYIEIKRICYREYVNAYYGGWVEDEQIKRNTETFREALRFTCFQKILQNGETVGFWGYQVLDDRIGGITIQLVASARCQGLGTLFLAHIVRLSNETDKPAYLKVFKSNPARRLYQRLGFCVYEESASHYFMNYVPTKGM